MVSHKIHFWFYSKPPIFFIGILFLIFNGVSLFGQIASCKSDFTIFLYGSGSAPIAVSDIYDGSTLSFEGKVSKLFSAKGSETTTRGMTYDTDLPSSIQPIFGDVELEFEKKRFETAIKFRFNGSKKLKEYNLVEGIDNIEQTPRDAETGGYYGTPSWNIFNFYSKYSLTKLL